MKQVRDINKQIKKTKSKFILFSIIGVLIIFTASILAFQYHRHFINQQKTIQVLYKTFNDQIYIMHEMILLGEKIPYLDSKEQSTKTINQFKTLTLALNEKNKVLKKWFSLRQGQLGVNAGRFQDKQELKKKIESLILKTEKLAQHPPQTIEEVKAEINFLTTHLQSGFDDIFAFFDTHVNAQYQSTLVTLDKVGILLIILCIVEIFLVWLLVFKPLFSMVVNQQERFVDALFEANTASRSKTDFLANISHEIRTPMTSILGYVDLLKSKPDHTKDEFNSFLQVIDKNASHLLSLIDEILDVSKIEAGKIDIKKEAVELPKLLNEVYSLINVKAREKKIYLEFRNEGQIPKVVHTDPKRIKQILFNTVGNAIKFTEQNGRVELVVSYNPELKDNLCFRVIDTGVGIPKDKVNKIFKPFEQSDSSNSRKFGGTGLGLALSRGIARKLGGNIIIESSELNKGTTFKITLCANIVGEYSLLERFSTNIEEGSVPHGQDKNKQLFGKKILVVDDAFENARLFKIFLNKAGAETDVATSGIEALNLTQSNKYDLVLLDLQMPGLDGFEVLRELRKMSFENPILALTAHAMDEEKQKTQKAGFDGHISKPVKYDELIEYVRTAQRRYA